MGSGGGSSDGGGTSENLNPPTVRRTPVRERTGPAAAKMSEVGVSRKPARGMSPAAARAITGSDRAAANIAGRPDINVAQLGDLQTRATVGTRGLGETGTVGGVLNTIGAASAARLLDKIKNDTPTIGQDGEVKYSVDPVTDPRTGAIVGVTEPGPSGGRVYSGRPDMNPFRDDTEQESTPEVTPEMTPDITPDDEEEQTILGRGRGAGQKRRTRGTRVGGAGSFETGYGVLLRGPSATTPSGPQRLT